MRRSSGMRVFAHHAPGSRIRALEGLLALDRSSVALAWGVFTDWQRVVRGCFLCASPTAVDLRAGPVCGIDLVAVGVDWYVDLGLSRPCESSSAIWIGHAGTAAFHLYRRRVYGVEGCCAVSRRAAGGLAVNADASVFSRAPLVPASRATRHFLRRQRCRAEGAKKKKAAQDSQVVFHVRAVWFPQAAPGQAWSCAWVLTSRRGGAFC